MLANGEVHSALVRRKAFELSQTRSSASLELRNAPRIMTEPRRFRFRLLPRRTEKEGLGDSGNRFSRFGRQGDHGEGGLIIIRMQYRDIAGVSGVSSEKIALERFADVDYHSRRKNTPETVLVIDIRITATITADITDRGISGRDTA